jgi:dTDP-4-amino-4,6-dideoxygalactose transaminase
MYYVLVASEVERHAVLATLKQAGVHAVFHYVPLHSSPGGRRYGRVHGDMHVTDALSQRLLRLPMWVDLQPVQQDRVISALRQALES